MIVLQDWMKDRPRLSTCHQVLTILRHSDNRIGRGFPLAIYIRLVVGKRDNVHEETLNVEGDEVTSLIHRFF